MNCIRIFLFKNHAINYNEQIKQQVRLVIRDCLLATIWCFKSPRLLCNGLIPVYPVFCWIFLTWLVYIFTIFFYIFVSQITWLYMYKYNVHVFTKLKFTCASLDRTPGKLINYIKLNTGNIIFWKKKSMSLASK